MNDFKQSLLASVLICTRNRAEYLGRTIRAVAAQSMSGNGFEILIVDNGSIDRTLEVVRECQSTITKVTVRYVFEGEIGLSVARNRAIREAKGEILCFLDDDAVPEPEWLPRLCAVFAQSEKILCAGGTIIPEYEAKPPRWFDKKCEGIFKPTFKHPVLHSTSYPHYPYGANYAVKASAFRIIGKFDTRLGYSGSSLIPGEETDFLRRIELAGYRIMVDPIAVVRHVIPAGRLTKEYFIKRTYAQGCCDAILHWRFDENPMPVDWKNRLWGLSRSVMRLAMAYGRHLAKWIVAGRAPTMREYLDWCNLKGYAHQECILWLQLLNK